jgi:hypothetical protein
LALETQLFSFRNEGKKLCVESQLVRLCELLAAFSRRGWTNLFVIFRGYFDESYSEKVFTLSCLASDPTGWAAIERGWKLCLVAKNRELKAQGRPQISRYHAADCSSLQGEFSGWSVSEQVKFAKELMATMSRGRAWVNNISYSIPLNDFIKEFDIKGDPIPVCYEELVKFVMLEMTAQIREAKEQRGSVRPVLYVLFHERCNHDGLYLAAFNKMLGDETFTGKEHFSTIAPLGWEYCIPLQPADMIAYETFKEAERQLTGRKRRKSLEFLMQSRKFGGRSKQFERKNLQEWCDVVRTPPAK